MSLFLALSSYQSPEQALWLNVCPSKNLSKITAGPVLSVAPDF